jgi:hypothetical protein
MSVIAMAFVWKLKLPHDEKFVLLAYADNANDNGGSIFPALLTIANKTGYSKRSVQEITKKLEKRGLLLRNGRSKHATVLWRIPLDFAMADSAMADSAIWQSSASAIAESAIPSMLQTATEPSLTIKEPSLKPDVLDGIIKYHLHPKQLQNAIAEYFKLTPNWEAKYNRQFMEWAIESKMTPEEIRGAADLWRSDKRFNWAAPSLKGIQEHWLELKGISIMQSKPLSELERAINAMGVKI